MRTCFVILLLICISLMYTVQAESSIFTTTTTTTTPKPMSTSTSTSTSNMTIPTSKPSGSENCVATLTTLVMTLVTVFILQAKDWFC